MSNFRIGHGYDAHRFTEERKLVIGGVNVDYSRGLLGHSDADVLVHAIIDALLGAAALGDIGRHFPDTDDKYRDFSSILMLEKVGEMLRVRGYTLSNIDATLVMQKPKISEYIPQMTANIAKALSASTDLINIKATTEEGMGFTGNGEGACAHAVALIELTEK